MKARVILALMALTGLAVIFAAQAQEGPGSSSGSEIAKLKDDLRLREQILARQFAEFENSLLKLKDRLKRSGKKEDAQRAEILEQVLEQSKDASISVQFEQMVEMLKTNKLAGIGDLKILDERSHKLADDLREILAKMREDPKHARLRDERLNLEKLIKAVEKIIHDQRIVQGQTDRNKTDPKELKSNQGQVTKATDKLAKDITKNNQGGEAKNNKGQAKDGGKEGKKGESKDEGKVPPIKKGESKEAGPNAGSKDVDKKGEAKGDKGAAGADKGGEKTDKGGDKSGKNGEKADKGGEKSDKGGDKSGKSGEKSDKGGEKSDKSGDKSSPDSKKGEAKPASKSEPKETSKPGSKGDAKPGAAKPGQKADSKPGEAKPGKKSDGQGEAKSGDMGDPEKADEKGEPPQAQQPKDSIANGRKQVQDAEYKMKQAEDKIAKKNNKDASEDQGKAIQDLEKAKKKLEDLLRQIREEELERLLAALQARCEKMLAMQIQVQTGTDTIFRLLDATADKKPSRQNQQDSLKLSDNEKDIVTEANKAIEMMEAEGSAVAFPEVFQQVRQDMMHIQRRLEVTDAGLVTQAIEKDVVDTLKEMIDALKKARKDQEKDKDKQKPPPGSSPPPGPRDQKLLDQIAELKMIRSMQVRVNTRTETYGKMYVPKEGEQSADPAIRRELSNLSERQERIFDVTNRIAKGDNK